MLLGTKKITICESRVAKTRPRCFHGKLIVSCRYRWQIKWRYYKLRYLKKRRRSNRILLGSPDHGDMYSAYVVYAYDDDTARQWVTQTLLPRVEHGLQKPPMFIRGRDDLAGQSNRKVIGGTSLSIISVFTF